MSDPAAGKRVHFVVDRAGVITPMSLAERLAHMGVSGSAAAAYDLLTDDGMSPEQAAGMAVAAERGGRDAEGFARHLRTLRAAVRQGREESQ